MGTAAKGDDKKNIVKLAYLYFQEGRWDNAITEYEKLLELDPEDINIHNMLGDVYVKKNDISKAYAEYIKVSTYFVERDQQDKILLVNKKIARLDRDQLSPEAQKKQSFVQLKLKADQALEENRIEEAVEMYGEILKLEPDELSVVSKLAELEEKLGRIPGAIEQYTRLGESFFKSHLFKKAQEMFKKIILIDGSNVEAHLKLAQIYIKQGSESDAKKEYLNIAEQALAKKDLDGAFEYATKAVELKSIEAHYILGIVFFERQKWAEAKSEFEALLRFKLNHVGALVYFGKVYDGMGQAEKAVEAFQKALKAEKDNAFALESWAEYCVKKKNKNEAIQTYTLLIDKNLQGNNGDRAVELAKTMVSIDENLIPSKLKLAQVMEKSGDRNGAADVYYNLALICTSENKTEDAKLYIKKTLELNPSHAKAKGIASESAPSDSSVEAVDKNSQKSPSIDPAKVSEQPKIKVVEVSPQEAFKAQLDVADQYVQQGLLDEAIDIYQQLIELEPNNLEVKTKLNKVYTAYAKTGTDLASALTANHEMEEAEKEAAAETANKDLREQEAKAREEADKKVKEEMDRRTREEAEKKTREEAEKKVHEEAQRIARENDEKKVREEADRKAKEELERKAREEADKKVREEAQRIALENVEKRDREEAEKRIHVAAQQKLQEEAQRIARENIERKDREEAEKKAKEELERKAREEAEKKVRDAAEQKLREEAQRIAREEAEKRAKEESEKKVLNEMQNKIREAVEKKTREQAEKREREKAEQEMEQKIREEIEIKVREEMERKRREETAKKIREVVEKKVREDVERRVTEEVDRRTQEELEKNYQEEEKKKAREEAKKKIREEMAQKSAELSKMVAVAEADHLANEERYEEAIKLYKSFLETHPDHPEVLKKLKAVEGLLKLKSAHLSAPKAPSYLKVIESPATDSDDDKKQQSGKIGYV
jgi:tetratricopeptide (TPR) repeat protein